MAPISRRSFVEDRTLESDEEPLAPPRKRPRIQGKCFRSNSPGKIAGPTLFDEDDDENPSIGSNTTKVTTPTTDSLSTVGSEPSVTSEFSSKIGTTEKHESLNGGARHSSTTLSSSSTPQVGRTEVKPLVNKAALDSSSGQAAQTSESPPNFTSTNPSETTSFVQRSTPAALQRGSVDSHHYSQMPAAPQNHRMPVSKSTNVDIDSPRKKQDILLLGLGSTQSPPDSCSSAQKGKVEDKVVLTAKQLKALTIGATTALQPESDEFPRIPLELYNSTDDGLSSSIVSALKDLSGGTEVGTKLDHSNKATETLQQADVDIPSLSRQRRPLHDGLQETPLPSDKSYSNLEDTMRELKVQMTEEHAETVKWLLEDAKRVTCPRPDYTDNVSPFASMGSQSCSMMHDHSPSVVLITYDQAPTHKGKQSVARRKSRVKATTIRSNNPPLPRYANHIGVKRNILTRPFDRVNYTPCVGGANDQGEESMIEFLSTMGKGFTTFWKAQKDCLNVERAQWMQSWLIRYLEEADIDVNEQQVAYYILGQVSTSRRPPQEQFLFNHYEKKLPLIHRDAVLERAQMFSKVCEAVFGLDSSLMDEALSTSKTTSSKESPSSKGTPSETSSEYGEEDDADTILLTLKSILLPQDRVQDLVNDILRVARPGEIKDHPDSTTYADLTCIYCNVIACPTHGDFAEDYVNYDYLQLPDEDDKSYETASREQQYFQNYTVMKYDAMHRRHDARSEGRGLSIQSQYNARRQPTLEWYNQKKRTTKPNLINFTKTFMHERRTISYPCNHDGPCMPTNCACAKDNHLCETACSCHDDCYRRFKGCSCASQDLNCVDNASACACQQLHRECGSQCLSCGAVPRLDPKQKYNEALFSTGCQNVAIQRGVFTRAVVGESQLLKRIALQEGKDIRGYGVYNVEPVKKNQFLGEYVAELITIREAERRGAVYNKRHSSYLFDLNGNTTLDAYRFGNHTKFLNHSEGADVNMAPVTMFVNGVHRIKFIATKNIPAGTELVFNYGKDFAEVQGLTSLKVERIKKKAKQQKLEDLGKGQVSSRVKKQLQDMMEKAASKTVPHNLIKPSGSSEESLSIVVENTDKLKDDHEQPVIQEVEDSEDDDYHPDDAVNDDGDEDEDEGEDDRIEYQLRRRGRPPRILR